MTKQEALEIILDIAGEAIVYDTDDSELKSRAEAFLIVTEMLHDLDECVDAK